jgi:DNA-binding GntR family transcriptional regulator
MEAKLTLTDQAYERLREDIVHGAFHPGDKLRIEFLKQTYDVGATPLREALYRLSADGFVHVQGQRGFRVADMSLEELKDITNLRVVLEGMALTPSHQGGKPEGAGHPGMGSPQPGISPGAGVLLPFALADAFPRDSVRPA